MPDTDPKHAAYHIEALARGLAVLSAFSPEQPELSLTEIAAATGTTQVSALRMSYTLAEAGYLIRNPMTKKYRLGPKILGVALATLSSMTLPELVEPYLVDLRNRTQENVTLAVSAGPYAVVIGRMPSRRHPASMTFLGTHLPIHACSLGRAILAWLPSDEVESILAISEDRRYTAKTIPPGKVRAELARTRKRGYALNDQGTTVEHRSVAAPLLNPGGRPIGAINLSVSAQRISLAELDRRLAPEVVECAAVISTTIPPQVLGAGHQLLSFDETNFLTG
jgi:IclR family pca regulon transcriptional regulator